MSSHPTSEGDPSTYRIPQDGICIARDRDGVRCTEERVDGLYCARHHGPAIPPPANPADPVSEGLAVVVSTGRPSIDLLACAECGVLLWDVEAHWTDAHAHRLQAIRARSQE